MKQITWNDETVRKAYNLFRHLEPYDRDNRTWGHVTEQLVREDFGLPMQECVADEGYDLIIDGFKVDVKNTVVPCAYMDGKDNDWVVNCYKQLVADFYLFTCCDHNKHRASYIGFLSKYEVSRYARYVRKGEQLYENGKAVSNTNCYVVSRKLLHRLKEDTDIGVAMTELYTGSHCIRTESGEVAFDDLL